MGIFDEEAKIISYDAKGSCPPTLSMKEGEK